MVLDTEEGVEDVVTSNTPDTSSPDDGSSLPSATDRELPVPASKGGEP
jgi:hypothetical protein